MFIKDVLYKIKEDIKDIFKRQSFVLNTSGEINYDEYWESRRSNLSKSELSVWQKKRADAIIPFLSTGDMILDIGCGDGNMLQYIKKNCDIEPIGVDISNKSVTTLREKGIKVFNLDVTKTDLLVELPDVDYLTGFEVIEHMSDPEKFIYAIKSKVRKGFIFSFPNTGYYTHRFRLLSGKFPLQWRVHPGEHVRFWTVDDAKWWVSHLGFKLDKIILYEGVPFLNKVFPKLFAQGIIIVMHEEHE